MKVEYEVFYTHAGKTFVTKSRDISPGGIGIYTGDELKIGTPLDLTIVMPEGAMSLNLSGAVKYTEKSRERSADHRRFVAGVEFDGGSLDELPAAETGEEFIGYSASHSLIIDAPPEFCFNLLSEHVGLTELAGFVEETKVLEKYPDGRPRLVEIRANALIRTFSSVSECFYDDENLCQTWKRIKGDLIEGGRQCRFTAVGPDKCRYAYAANTKMDFPIPGRLVHYFSVVVLRRTMKKFKKMAEEEYSLRKAR